jgi:cytochrome P450
MAASDPSLALDTVTNLLSFTAWHLAEHPEHRRRILDDPEIIPRAAEIDSRGGASLIEQAQTWRRKARGDEHGG